MDPHFLSHSQVHMVGGHESPASFDVQRVPGENSFTAGSYGSMGPDDPALRAASEVFQEGYGAFCCE